MKLLIILICLFAFSGICYFIHYVSTYIKFQNLKINDAVWSESEYGTIAPTRITKINTNKCGKIVSIQLDNEKILTFNELRKSEYTL